LKRQLGPRAADAVHCPEGELAFEDQEHLFSTTKVRITGCGREGTWVFVEGHWEKVRAK
jgi:hypothetical protein